MAKSKSQFAIDSPFGLITYGFDADVDGFLASDKKVAGGVSWLRIGESPAKDAASVESVNELLQAWFTGEVDALLDIPVVAAKTSFIQIVRRAMRNIEPGSPISYSQLAEKSGRPTAVRAAASVCSRNPIPIIVPCHRVVRNDGSVGNYFYGSDMKIQMLEMESR